MYLAVHHLAYADAAPLHSKIITKTKMLSPHRPLGFAAKPNAGAGSRGVQIHSRPSGMSRTRTKVVCQAMAEVEAQQVGSKGSSTAAGKSRCSAVENITKSEAWTSLVVCNA